jgi:autotransporter-associated beta strand protein
VNLAKSGAGTLVLLGDNFDFYGTLSIGGGVLQIGDGGTAGVNYNPISNSGTLRYKRSDPSYINYALSGTGDLDQAGTGELEISTPTTFTGATTISSGSLLLSSGAALQKSTLDYTAAGGTISYGLYLGVITLGGLSGDGDLPLVDLVPSRVGMDFGLFY